MGVLWLSFILVVFGEVHTAKKGQHQNILHRENDIAYIELVLYQNDNKGDYVTSAYRMEGKFANIGSLLVAEGHVIELNDDDYCVASDLAVNKDIFGLIGVIKVSPNNKCSSAVDKAKAAFQKGATAMIFDVTDDVDVLEQLQSLDEEVNRPIVVVMDLDAQRILAHIKGRKNSFIRIKTTVTVIPESNQETTSNEYFDMGIFMAFFIFVSLICLILLIKIRWRQKRKKTSLIRMAMQALKQMEIRKHHSEINLEEKSSFDIKNCAVCLEKLIDGQDIRIVPCRHEFHQQCVDPWLIANFTCPLCMYSIVESRKSKSKQQQRVSFFTSFFIRRNRSNSTNQIITSVQNQASCQQEQFARHQSSREQCTSTEPLIPRDTLLPRVIDKEQCKQTNKDNTTILDKSHMSRPPYRFHKCLLCERRNGGKSHLPFNQSSATLLLNEQSNTSSTAFLPNEQSDTGTSLSNTKSFDYEDSHDSLNLILNNISYEIESNKYDLIVKKQTQVSQNMDSLPNDIYNIV